MSVPDAVDGVRASVGADAPVAESSSESSAPVAPRSFFDDLPSWGDHRPSLAGAPPAPPAVAAGSAATEPLSEAAGSEASDRPQLPSSETLSLEMPLPMTARPETAPSVLPTGVPETVEAPEPSTTSGAPTTYSSPVAGAPATPAVPPAASDVVERTLAAVPSHDGSGPSSPDPVPGDAESAGPPRAGSPTRGGALEPGGAAYVAGGVPAPRVPGPLTDVTTASTDDSEGPPEVGYDYLFGRTVDRDAYLAKLVALGERSDEHADADEPVRVRPTTKDQPAAASAVLGADSTNSAEPPGADPAALPQIATPAGPASQASNAGLLISSVPWATRKDPASSNATTPVTPRPPDARPPTPTTPTTPVPMGPPVGGWPTPQVPGAPVVGPVDESITTDHHAEAEAEVPPHPAVPPFPGAPAPFASREEPPAPAPRVTSVPGPPRAAPPSPVSPLSPNTPESLPRPVSRATETAAAGAQFYSGRPSATASPTRPSEAVTPVPSLTGDDRPETTPPVLASAVTGPTPLLPPPAPSASVDTVAMPALTAVPEIPRVSADPDLTATADEPEKVKPDEPDEPDDRTVDRSALLARDQGTGPSVMGVLCPAGHPNAPDRSRCRQCSEEIAAQQPTMMLRPPLGFLRLTSGDVVTLDRGVILGRAPKPPLDVPAAFRPHVVRVASPRKDVSRTHLEVVLDGWHVLVRDLDATNGSTVTIPGRPPVRLRADEQQVIEPGTRISLADEVELTFEVER